MFDLSATIIENSALISAFWEKVGPPITKKLGQEYQKSQILFGRHLETSLKKNSTTKLLSSRTTPTPLSDVYVSNNFKCKDSSEDAISDAVFIEDIRSGMRVVVRGNGGTGKTFFLKHFWNKIFDDPRGTIPVFVELRKFNDFHSSDLETFIKYTVTNGKDLDDQVFKSLIETGSLVLMFDGFDELVKSKRRDIERQILSLEEKCPNCPIIVSSRANSIFNGWTNFHIFDVVGFTLPQVEELVEKSTVDEDTKKAFLKVLNQEFYDEHQTFLEIPLLALMMLITFRDTASIPANIDAFYSSVFLTLYQNHDAMKESLDREKYLGLVELQRFFAVFCFLTYIKEKYEFTKLELLEEIETASRFLNNNPEFNTQIDNKPEEILHDLEECVNLVFQDGLSYLFVHRSFQEYFTAYFAIKMEDENTEELLNRLGERFFDSVIRIAYHMKPTAVLSKYIVPKYKSFEKDGAFKRIVTMGDASKISEIDSQAFLFFNNYTSVGNKKIETGVQVHLTSGGSWNKYMFQLRQLNLQDFGKNDLFEQSDIRLSSTKQFNNKKVIKEMEGFFANLDSDQFAVRVGGDSISFDGYHHTVDKDGAVIGVETIDLTAKALSHFSDDFINDVSQTLLNFAKSRWVYRERVGKILAKIAARQKANKKKSISDLYNI